MCKYFHVIDFTTNHLSGKHPQIKDINTIQFKIIICFCWCRINMQNSDLMESPLIHAKK